MFRHVPRSATMRFARNDANPTGGGPLFRESQTGPKIAAEKADMPKRSFGPHSNPRRLDRGPQARAERLSFRERLLMVETRSLRSAFRAPVETTEITICDDITAAGGLAARLSGNCGNCVNVQNPTKMGIGGQCHPTCAKVRELRKSLRTGPRRQHGRQVLVASVVLSATSKEAP
jgi:hypothetical protein